MTILPLSLALASGGGGCSCQPTLPPPQPTESETTPTGSTGFTGDTAPEPPCDTVEVEPNDSITTFTPLAMESEACGVIDAPLDLDYWQFTLETDAWLQIEAEAGNGSVANMTFVLAPVDSTWAASRNDDRESVDATLRFPAPAGVYTLATSEQNFQGGERYSYDLLVSEAKAPTTWTRAEVEPNDDTPEAEVIADGDAVFGTIEGNGALPDFDWYVLTVPAGSHTLVVDVDAFDLGSSANLTAFLFDRDLQKLPDGCKTTCGPTDPLCETCALDEGIPGLDLDPVGQYDSLGAELVYIQVFEANDREGPANWYVLNVRLEAR
ncbi:MAG: hypothetical protein ABMB14_10615 [Myxococcota bacterium]